MNPGGCGPSGLADAVGCWPAGGCSGHGVDGAGRLSMVVDVIESRRALSHRHGVAWRIGEAGAGSDCARNRLPDSVVGEHSLMRSFVKTLFVTVELKHGSASVVNWTSA